MANENNYTKNLQNAQLPRPARRVVTNSIEIFTIFESVSQRNENENFLNYFNVFLVNNRECERHRRSTCLLFLLNQVPKRWNNN